MPPDPKYLPPFSLEQQKVLALVPKFTSIPSIIGSLYIVQHVLRSSKRRQRTYHRLLAVMSIMDFIYAIKAFGSTWPNPAGTGYLTMGNTETCEAAAVLGHGGSLSSAMYNGSLTLYYLLTIAFSWRLDQIKRIEPLLHGLPLAIGWFTAFATIPMELMNPIGWTCWIGSYPVSCNVNPNIECTRGAHASIYRWAFFHIELWACFIFVAFAMGYIYFRIRKNELAIRKYQYDSSDRGSVASDSVQPQSQGGRSIFGTSGRTQLVRKQKKQKLSRKFASQAGFYILSFFLSWIFPMVGFLIAELTGYLFYPLLAATVVVNPLQGFFNALIYIRPRYIRYKEEMQRVSTNEGRNVPSRGVPSQMQVLRSAVFLSGMDDEDELEQLEDAEKDVIEAKVENAVDRTQDKAQNQSDEQFQSIEE